MAMADKIPRHRSCWYDLVDSDTEEELEVTEEGGRTSELLHHVAIGTQPLLLDIETEEEEAGQIAKFEYNSVMGTQLPESDALQSEDGATPCLQIQAADPAIAKCESFIQFFTDFEQDSERDFENLRRDIVKITHDYETLIARTRKLNTFSSVSLWNPQVLWNHLVTVAIWRPPSNSRNLYKCLACQIGLPVKIILHLCPFATKRPRKEELQKLAYALTPFLQQGIVVILPLFFCMYWFQPSGDVTLISVPDLTRLLRVPQAISVLCAVGSSLHQLKIHLATVWQAEKSTWSLQTHRQASFRVTPFFHVPGCAVDLTRVRFDTGSRRRGQRRPRCFNAADESRPVHNRKLSKSTCVGELAFPPTSPGYPKDPSSLFIIHL